MLGWTKAEEASAARNRRCRSTASSKMTGQRSVVSGSIQAAASLPGRAEEDGAVGAQHINGGDDHAPEREDHGELKIRSGISPAAGLKAPKKTVISLAKLAKPGRPMEAKAARPKAKPSQGMGLASPPKLSRSSRGCFSRSIPAMAKSAAMESPCANMSSAAPLTPIDIQRGDAEENVTHVHHARIAQHQVELLLRDGDQADVDDIADEQNEQQARPRFRSFRQQRQGDADETVEAELLQHAGMQHGGGRGRGGISGRRPGVEREKRDRGCRSRPAGRR